MVVLVLSLSCFVAIDTRVVCGQMPVYESVRKAESEHFRYIYQVSLDSQLPALIRDCEDAYSTLTPVFRWTPRDKVWVMFSDDLDVHNGWATSVPRPRMQIYASDSPAGSSIFEPGRYLRRTVFHEFTHVLTLDAQYGADAWLAGIFGRVVPVAPDPVSLMLTFFTLPPTLFAPTWVLEGFTTWVETEFVGPGRGRNAVADMVLRVAVADGRPLDPSKWDLNLPEWPYGQAAYLYGMKVMQYAQEQNGLTDPQRHVPGELSDSLAHSFACFVNRCAVPATGDTFSLLSRKAGVASTARQEKRIERLRSQPLTKVERLTPAGLQVERPVFAPDGALWFIGAPEEERAVICRYDTAGKRVERMESAHIEAGRGSRLAMAASGDVVYFTRLVPVGSDRYWNKLHAYDVSDRRVDELPWFERCRYPAISPDATKLVGVRVVGGVSTLQMLRFMGEGTSSVEDLVQSPADHSILDPVFLPDGKTVLYVLAGAEKSELRRVQVDPREDVLVFEWPHLILSPTVHPNGKEAVFSSDRTGVYNLYRLRLDATDAKPEPLTHVIGGLFHPAFSLEGASLAAVGFDSHGAFLTKFVYGDMKPRAELPPVLEPTWQPLKNDEAGRQAWKDRPVPPMPESGRYLSAMNTSLDYWSPWVAASSDGTVGGLQFSCSDPAGYQSLAAVGGRDFGAEETVGSVSWTLSGFRPILNLHASRSAALYPALLEDDAANRHDYEERRQEVGAALEFPIPGPDRYVTLSLGYRWGRQDARVDDETTYTNRTLLGRTVFEGRTAALTASLFGYSATAFPRSHSAEDGWRVQLSGEWMNESVGSEVDGVAGRLDAAYYWSLPAANHVLKFEAVGGVAGGDETAQGMFGLGGMAMMPGTGSGVVVDRSVGLRGYLENTQVGDKVTRFGLSYRLPLMGYYRSRGPVSAVYTHQLFVEVFGEAGRVWDAESGRADGEGWLRSVGAEMNCSMTLFHLLDVAPGIGVAYAADRYVAPNDEEASKAVIYLSVKGVVNF